MKKLVTIFVINAIASACFAQPILNKLYDFNIGHVYSYRKVPANWNIDTTYIPTKGSNLTWNFDTLTLSQTIYTDSILNASNSLGAAFFGSAKYVWKEYSGTLQYYKKDVDTVFYMGNYSSFPSLFTPNPKTAILPTTMSSGYVYNNFQTTVSGNGVWVYSARYNAFGTLKLPGVTHNNVGLYVTVGGKSNLQYADYLWFKENQVDPVIRIQFIWNSSGSKVQYLYVNTTALTPNTVDEVGKETFALYPNPCADILQLDAALEVKSVKIYNSIGVLVNENFSSGSSQKIDISNLSSGVYFVAVESSTGKQIVKSFVKN